MNRIYFGTDGIRGKAGKHPVSAEFALKLGWACAKTLPTLCQHPRNIVVIGKDTRNSCDMLEAALAAGLTAAGVQVYHAGVLPSPAIAYAVRSYQADAGAVISASHNPYSDNGIKFFSPRGEKLSDTEEARIEAYLDHDFTTAEPGAIGNCHRCADAADRYIRFALDTLSGFSGFSDYRVVLDCANGAASAIAPAVFQELGSTVFCINNTPDGTNINAQCGATHLDPLQQAVVDHQADIGFAYDGDADRLMAVDSSGRIIDGDELLYVLACHYQHQERLKGGVVGTLMTNFGIEQALARRQIPLLRAKVGDRYVMELLKQQQWLLGGESSGHLICLDSNSTGDGIIASLKILEIMAACQASLSELLTDTTKMPQHMINVTLNQPVQPGDLECLNQQVEQISDTLGEHGRVLLRPSGTEPVLRVMVEATDREQAEKYATLLAQHAQQQLA